jgi:sialic acid synthase SpsE
MGKHSYNYDNEGNRVYSLYVITNLLNNKKYIGYTIKTIEDRWKEHINIANRIAGIYSHYKRGHNISNEDLFLIRHLTGKISE